ncbi:Glycosyltransferase family 8 protein [Coniochaeta hoffmannii]|uniref:glycogenin glucosyltransferase n=1 Tax=Coniochaeta hoffmannii TaxID=91930 RepID=A0AA38VUG7_9PEZI|nr:Glycosyltransferase family 8 protein [Coniochaeta hoffmannii]
MAGPGGEDVYATLLLTDSYLPGALVLAHSLRDAKTTKKLAVLVTLDTVSVEVVTQLKAVFDYVIPVNRIRNDSPANLYLMDRPDLHSAFTKINLWKQTQFRKIVYIDADVVAYRAPDELFALPHAFSAAPDIGWPDLFNTGVMVLTPDMGEFYALLAMAERGISFDGADQGLLNMHFQDSYNRLSFSYNVTPSAHYQYIPAYRHFQSSISMIHFIGADKPWLQGRDAHTGSGPYNEMVGRWWAVYDRHYRKEIPSPGPLTVAPGLTEQAQSSQPTQQTPELVQYFVKGEYQPKAPYVVPVGEPPREDTGGSHEQVQGHQQQEPAAEPEHKPEPPQQASWDARWQPPPPDSKPEAMNFPQTHYEMSSDTAPFVPPPRYPSPPKNMWFEVPKEPPAPPAAKPRAIFPWETHQPRASRVFADLPSEPEPTPAEEPATEASEASTVEAKSEPETPVSQGGPLSPSTPWSSFPRTNAWDDVPEIERYVEGLQQKHRRTRSQGLKLGGLPPSGLTQEEVTQRRGSKLTDFPSEVERPSLPVTPAPIRRPKFWGGGAPGIGADEDEADDEEQLPAAQGVPAQSEWDPIAQLQKLAKQQSELLRQKLGEGGEGGSDLGVSTGMQGREIPNRPLPFGSEDIKSPTYVAQTSGVLSPKPVKPSSGTSPVQHLWEKESAATPRTTPGTSSNIPEPSYHGPGAQFEKNEDFMMQDTAAPPTEEELDVLDT